MKLMNIVIALSTLLLFSGCAIQPNRVITDLRPIKLKQVDPDSSNYGYIAASSFNQFTVYDNLGNVSKDEVVARRHCNTFRPDIKCPPSENSFAPVSNPSVAYDLSLDGFAVNTLYLFKVPVGIYHRRPLFGLSFNPFSPNYNNGSRFEIKPGEVMYFGHIHSQLDLEKNAVFGDHLESICNGIADKSDDAINKLKKANPNINLDTSLVGTFKMLTPNNGRNPCFIDKIN